MERLSDSDHAILMRVVNIRRSIMNRVSKTMAALIVGLAVSAFAQRSEGMSGGRAQALHECNVKAEKFAEHTWGNVEIYTYHSCMAQHGQQE
jgi:hypothetical protein